MSVVICVVHGKYRSKGNPSNFAAFLIWKRTTLIVWSALLQSREEQNERCWLNHRILELHEVGTFYLQSIVSLSVIQRPSASASVGFLTTKIDPRAVTPTWCWVLPGNLWYTHTDTTHTHPAWDIVKVKTAYLIQMLFFQMSKLRPKEIYMSLRLSSLLCASFKCRFSVFPDQWFPFQVTWDLSLWILLWLSFFSWNSSNWVIFKLTQREAENKIL